MNRSTKLRLKQKYENALNHYNVKISTVVHAFYFRPIFITDCRSRGSQKDEKQRPSHSVYTRQGY